MTSPAAWMLIPVALDMDSLAHPLHTLALRIDLRCYGDKAFNEGWPHHVPFKRVRWEN